MEKKTNTLSGRRLIVPAALICTLLCILAGVLIACGGKTTDSGQELPTEIEIDEGYDVQSKYLYSKKGENAFLSPSSVCVSEGKIYVSDATNDALYRMDGDGKIEKTVTFSATVSKVKAENGKVYVLWGELDGELGIFDADLNLEKTVPVGHTPTDLYISGNTAYIANLFSNSVSVVDLDKGEEIATVMVSREPCCLAAVGNVLYVGCRLQDGAANGETVSSKVCKIDLTDMTKNETVGFIALPNGCVNIRGITATGDGKIVVTHTVARYSYPTTQLDRGWVNSNGFSVIDPENDTPTAFLLDEVERGAANPWDVVQTEDEKYLVFSIAGTGELVRVEYKKIFSRVEKVEAGKDPNAASTEAIVNRIGFLSDVEKRLALPGDGVRALCIDGKKIYAAEYFTGDIVIADASLDKIEKTLSLGKQPEMTPEREGETLWHSAKFCYQNWESCSSCHPNARSDGLCWDEGGDGWGTPKNTKSMIFSVRTPPVLMTGVMENAEANVMGTVREAFRSGLADEKVEAMYAYLRSLQPVDSPYLNRNGTYTELAQRGKELFEEVGCAVCHPAPLYTDLKFRKSPYLGSDGSWEDRAFITPTLVEIWRSAPYTYSGGETDIMEIITKFSSRELTKNEWAELTRFVLSIGTVGEPYGVEEVLLTKDGETFYSRLEKGAALTGFTLRGQAPEGAGVPEPVVTAKLFDASGGVIAEKTFKPGKPVYGEQRLCEWALEIPDNLTDGAYLLISIADDAGGALCSDYKLVYRE